MLLPTDWLEGLCCAVPVWLSPQTGHGADEVQAFPLTHEVNHIAGAATTPAPKGLPPRIDGEAGCLLLMERAERYQSRTAGPKLHTTARHLLKGVAGLERLNVVEHPYSSPVEALSIIATMSSRTSGNPAWRTCRSRWLRPAERAVATTWTGVSHSWKYIAHA